MVNLDGFYLSFTREPVAVPEVPRRPPRSSGPFDPGAIQFRASQPLSQAVAVLGGSAYSYFRYETHLAAGNALVVYDEVADRFSPKPSGAIIRRSSPITPRMPNSSSS